ncbi:MAG: hypothetical protein L3J76_05995 [Candidatus Hydrothermae bacterium]|nr:hypothetical protein [Candidatus Hydrothermae bacterium]
MIRGQTLLLANPKKGKGKGKGGKKNQRKSGGMTGLKPTLFAAVGGALYGVVGEKIPTMGVNPVAVRGGLAILVGLLGASQRKRNIKLASLGFVGAGIADAVREYRQSKVAPIQPTVKSGLKGLENYEYVPQPDAIPETVSELLGN